MKENATKNHKKPLWILFLVFIGPLVLAMVMFYGRDYLPIPSANAHGTLIQPARPVELMRAVTSEGLEVTENHFFGHWDFILFQQGSCTLQCETALFKMRQARLLTGKDIQRVRLAMAVNMDSISDMQMQALQSRYSSVDFMTVSQLRFGNDAASSFQLHSGSIYVVDPLGNVMMEYSADATTKGMLKDLLKLLKISKVG